jgi:hypothetical protein
MVNDLKRATWWIDLADGLCEKRLFQRALLYYERALELCPNDPDASAKLEVAREQVVKVREAAEMAQRQTAAEEARAALLPSQIKFLYKIVAAKYTQSILDRGILSYNEVRRLGIEHVDISWASVQVLRQLRTIDLGKNAHDYVPLFFCWDPPMTFAVRGDHSVSILKISPEILFIDGVHISRMATWLIPTH